MQPLCPCRSLCLFAAAVLQLIHKKGKALILSEYGVGGGIHQNGSVPATTADEAASLPFFGIFGAYSPTIGGSAAAYGLAGQAVCTGRPAMLCHMHTLTDQSRCGVANTSSMHALTPSNSMQTPGRRQHQRASKSRCATGGAASTRRPPGGSWTAEGAAAGGCLCCGSAAACRLHML